MLGLKDTTALSRLNTIRLWACCPRQAFMTLTLVQIAQSTC